MMIDRRKLITGLISFVAAPAIVRASNLMPVKVMDFNKFVSYTIPQYDDGGYIFAPIRLYWLTPEGLKILPIEQSDTYLRNLDDNS